MSDKVIISLDSQVLSSMQTCPTYYAYRHVLNMKPRKISLAAIGLPTDQPKAERKSSSLALGLVAHDALKVHYEQIRAGNKPSDFLPLVLSRIESSGEENELTQKERQHIFQMYVEYVAKYENERFEVLAVEEFFQKLLYEDDNYIVYYTGITDLVVGIQDLVMPYDHKTFSSYFKPHGLENQFQGYAWALGVSTICVNRIGLNAKLGTFERILFSYSPEQLEEWKTNVVLTIQDALVQQESGFYRKNYEACGNYGGCRYKRLCTADPNHRDYLIRNEYEEVEPWDPRTRDS
jgi:hypothetical protein